MELSLEEVELVLQTLVYDNKLEKVQSSVILLTGQTNSGQTMYKVSRAISIPNYSTEVPCGICPVISQCCEGGNISPTTCVYMKQWLNMEDII